MFKMIKEAFTAMNTVATAIDKLGTAEPVSRPINPVLTEAQYQTMMHKLRQQR